MKRVLRSSVPSLGLVALGWLAGCGPGISLAPMGSSVATAGDARAVAGASTTAGASTAIATGDILQLVAGAAAPAPRPRIEILGVAANQALAGRLQTFLAAWGDSTAFADQVGEYGILSLEVPTPRIDDFVWPAKASDAIPPAGSTEPTDIERLLAADFTATSDDFNRTIAVVLVPPGTSVAFGSAATEDACSAGIYAWHASYALPDSNVRLPYVVVPSCSPLAGLSGDETASVALSHALINTLTNPHGNAFGAVGARQGVWQRLLGQPEAASLCGLSLYGSGALLARPAGVPLPVHRSWSNRAARAGSSPCAPSDADEIYTMAKPEGLKVLPAAEANGAEGLVISAGQTLTVPVKLLASDGKASGIGVAATELSTHDLTMTWSHASGDAGDLLALNIALLREPSAGLYIVRLTSSLGVLAHSQYLLLLVGSAS